MGLLYLTCVAEISGFFRFGLVIKSMRAFDQGGG